MGIFFPKEIITDILSRLPNESLWECKLVCKPWRDLIVSDPSFTHMHIQHRLSGTHGDHDSFAGKVSFIFQLPVPYEFMVAQDVKRLYYGEFDKTNQKFVRIKDLDLTHEDANNGYDIDRINPHYRWGALWGEEPWELPNNNEVEHYEEIVGSCNGLVCITLSYNLIEVMFYKPLYVCNPMTRECVVLPEITVHTDDVDDDDEPYYSDNYAKKWGGIFYDGFGYSPSTKEYKVVRIYNDEVYVYTLGDGKGWRHIRTKKYKSGIGDYIHGACSWLDKDRNLVSFDLADEKFGVLPSPPCFRDWDKYSYELREDGECLSIVHRNQRDVYDIWLLENCEPKMDEQDYQQSWRWTKKCTLYDDRETSKNLNKKKPKPFAITKDNEVLFHDHRFFYRHDLNTRTSYPLVGFKKRSWGWWYIYKAVRHVNSFVSLKALGERDTKTLTQDKIIVQKSLLPELTYNIMEKDTKKRKERCWNLDPCPWKQR